MLKNFLIYVAVFVLIIVLGFWIFFSIETRVTNNSDTYVYNLPFAKSKEYRVVQGYGGLFSHKNAAAIDFSMPVGTPIHAAREGKVYSYQDKYKKGGPFAKFKNQSNYIIIKHPDGSFGCYWHLKQNGVVVKKGGIEKGQLIGYSGRTGFVLYPHLHFSVKRALNYKMDSFVKTKFKTEKGIVFLKKGAKYFNPQE
jgi:murein DD-endopeptidase MepM/ murein hydrolase activator NlpD